MTTAQNANLEIRLFGGWNILLGHEPLPARPLAEQRLLVWLALHGSVAAEREMIAGILWPDSLPERSLFYLRRALSGLRGALAAEESRLESPTKGTLRFDATGLFVDVAVFDEAVTRGDEASLITAVEMHRGPVLPHWQDEWLAAERIQREFAYVDSLERLGHLTKQRGDCTASVVWLRRAVAADPLRETAQCALLEALASVGDHAGMTRAYRIFRVNLHDELGSSPSEDTAALYRRLQAEARRRASPPRRIMLGSAIEPVRRLPCPIAPLVGREFEIEQAHSCIRANRLVTLTGAGGIGKTRLAIAVTDYAENDFVDGVWFVDLASLPGGADITAEIASALGLRENPGEPLLESLIGRLEQASALLVLDNCEHVLDSAARTLEPLLAQCPLLKALATSRQPLGLPGEACWRVPSLAVPGIDEPQTDGLTHVDTGERAEALAASPAVRLFLDRAQRAASNFADRPGNLEAIASICRNLGGIPLAIELAASRVRTLSIEDILDRLGDRYHLLTGGSRTLARHQTLRKAMDWSWDLLDGMEQALLARLSAFSGGWTLDAAEAMYRDLPPVGATSDATSSLVDVLGSLIDKSLVQIDVKARPTRYALMETVRQYGYERLRQRDEEELTRSCHANWCLAFAEAAEPMLRGAESALWLDRLEAELDNIRAAFASFECAGDPIYGLRLGGALTRFWYLRGYFSEGRAFLSRSLEREESQTKSKERAKALLGAGVLANFQSDFAAAESHQAEALCLWQSLGDRSGMAMSLNNLGSIALKRGLYDVAHTYYSDSLLLWRDLGDLPWLGLALCNLGIVTYCLGDYGAALELHEESLRIRRKLPDRRDIAESLDRIADLAVARGEYASARAILEESLEVHEEMGDRHRIARNLGRIGEIAGIEGDFELAMAYQLDSLALFRNMGDRSRIAIALRNLGDIAVSRGDIAAARARYAECLELQRKGEPERELVDTVYSLARFAQACGQHGRAVRLCAAFMAHQTAHQVHVVGSRSAAQGRWLEAARTDLGPGRFASEWEAGSLLTLGEAIDHAQIHERANGVLTE